MKQEKSRLNAESGLQRFGNPFALVFILIAIGVVAVLAYASVLKAMGWDTNREGKLAVPVKQMFTSADSQIYLYVSPDTARYLQSVGGNYDVILKPWRNFFVQQKIQYEEVNNLASLPAKEGNVVVLPSVVAISDRERNALQQYQDRGGNILATSTFAARNGNGEWTGYDFVKQLLGVEVVGEIPPEKEERHLNLAGDLPFSQSYEVAERIWLGKMGAYPLRIKGGKTAGVITDWARTSVDVQGNETAAVLYGEFGRDKEHARWVMFSFSEVTWEVQRNDVHNLIANSITWLQHRPMIYKANWPFPYQAAQVIEMDTEEGFQNAKQFAAMMEKIDASATFYMLTSVALQFPAIVKDLAKRHEIGYHGDVHDGFKGQPEAVQAKRIDTMQQHMRSILGDISNLTGFRAPTESYDKTTEDLLVKKGIRYHAADPNRTNARLPLFYPDTKGASQQALVVLPRTQLDDINLIKNGQNDKDAITEALINDFNQVLQTGALGWLSIHTQHFGEDSPLAAAMPEFLVHVNKHRDKVWVAPANKVAEWWRARERLTYKVAGTQARLALDVTIHGSKPIPGASLIIANPIANAQVQLRPLKSNTVLPSIQAIDEFRTALVFSGMRPGSYAYSVTFSGDQEHQDQ